MVILQKTALVRGIFSFEGFPEPAVMNGCERATTAVYWAMCLFAVVPAAWIHLVESYTPVGWIYVIAPLVFAPVIVAKLPRSQSHRLLIISAGLLVIGLSINQLNGLGAQPGMFVMVPSVIIAYCIWGARGWLLLSGVQLIAILSTSIAWGIPSGNATPMGLFTANMLWLSVNLACAAMVRQILLASRHRAGQLTSLVGRLDDSESRLRENEASLRHIVTLSVDEIDEATRQLSDCNDRSQHAAALKSLRAASSALRESVVG